MWLWKRRDLIASGLAAVAAACGGGSSDTTSADTGGDADADADADSDTDADVDTATTTTGTTDFCTDAKTGSGWQSVDTADFPELATIGDYAYVDLGGRKLIVSQVLAGCYVALDRVCTHAGCDIKHSIVFSCPCHGSQWDNFGKLLGGPAADQQAFAAVLDADGHTLWLQVG